MKTHNRKRPLPNEPTTPDRPAVVNRQVAADIASISGTPFVSEPLDVTDLERLTAVTAPSVGGCVVTSLDLLGPPGAVDAPISSWVPSSGGAPRLEVDSLPPTVRVRIGVDSTPCQVPWTVWGQR
jgi:hypothetical protein